MQCATVSGVTVAALVLWIASECAAQAAPDVQVRPRVIETMFPTEDVVVASVVVEASRDGAGDASGTIQSAIDTAAAAGGAVVFVPAGRYRLERPIVIKEGVTLRGDWLPPDKPGAMKGTMLMPVADRGNPDGPPAITIERGAGIRECIIWYPEQKPYDIVPYPWTLRTSTTVNGDNYTVENVTLVNPYQAFKTGPEANELHTLRNVYGTPLKTGVWVDSTTDIGRLVGLDFGPQWWEQSGLPNAPQSAGEREALRDYLLRKGVGIDMGRSDWEYLYDIRIEAYSIGLKVRKGEQGATNAVLFGGRIVDCATALRLDALNDVGLSATGCTFTARDLALHALASFDTTAQFNACEFGGNPVNHVVLERSGTLSFQNCTFAQGRNAAINASAGMVSVMNCAFAQAGPHIRLGEGVLRARILGNTFEGVPGIINASENGDIMVSHQTLDSARPDTSFPPAPPPVRPATAQLFVVSDFGAAPDKDDNRAAFAAALDAARKAGGGTVYVPAGRYRFAGELVAPAGVELRGVSDVPHHTQSGGSVLMPIAGRGQEDGTPFIRLEPGAGLRGLTIWYPEQNLLDIAPYPWAVQGLGPRCWLINVTLGNAYQAVDFWTHPSDGHVIRYLAGGILRRGLFVSKCDGRGWVEDIQFNPHYALRIPPDFPRPAYDHEPFKELIDQQRHYLEGIAIGNCSDEQLVRNFLYAAHDGLAFRPDGAAGPNARVINHGTDTGSRALVVAASGERGIECINTQLVPLGDYEVGAIVVEDAFNGKIAFFNSQMWAGNTSAIIGGKGRVLLQQLNTLSGRIALSGGDSSIENVRFDRDLTPHIVAESGIGSARLIGNAYRAGVLALKNEAGTRCRALASSASFRPTLPDGTWAFKTGWEADEPQGLADNLAEPGGGLKSVSNGACHPVEAEAHTGRRALRIAGNADDPAYSYVYFTVFEQPLVIYPDSVFSYWFRPANERSRCVSVDLRFSDGQMLRETGLKTRAGTAVHPETPKGTVGEWRLIAIPLGRFFGEKTIDAILFAYDSREGGGPFEAFVDDIALESEGSTPYQVKADPRGGLYSAPVSVVLSAPPGVNKRYTLDGTNPGPDSPLYEAPLMFNEPGLHELRYAAQLEDARVGATFGELYNMAETKSP